MSNVLAITLNHNDARLAATQVYADTGSGHSYFELYDNARPAAGAAPGVTPVVTIVLADPCGTIVSHKLRLTQQDPIGDLIARDSDPAGVQWGRWFQPDGVTIVADFDVSDDAGDGFVKITGAGGTVLYAGGRAIMGLTELL